MQKNYRTYTGYFEAYGCRNWMLINFGKLFENFLIALENSLIYLYQLDLFESVIV